MNKRMRMFITVSLIVIDTFAQNGIADRKLPLEGGKTYKVTVGV